MRGALFGVAVLGGMLCIAAAGLVLTVASRTIRVAPVSGPGDSATAHYAAGLGAVAFKMQVVAVDRTGKVSGIAPAPADLHDLRVEVTFTNASHAQQRADLHDFLLQDATGVARRPATGGDNCPAWPKTDLHAAANDGVPPRDAGAQQVGPSFGPVPLCFRVAGNPDGQLRLQWDPDVSSAILSTAVEVVLPPGQTSSEP